MALQIDVGLAVAVSKLIQVGNNVLAVTKVVDAEIGGCIHAPIASIATAECEMNLIDQTER